MRLKVFRSNKHIYGQIIDEKKRQTLVAANDRKLTPSVDRQVATPVNGKRKKTERAREVGKLLAEMAIKKGIKEISFDRGEFKYHGRIKALADGAREGGLKF